LAFAWQVSGSGHAKPSPSILWPANLSVPLVGVELEDPRARPQPVRAAIAGGSSNSSSELRVKTLEEGALAAVVVRRATGRRTGCSSESEESLSADGTCKRGPGEVKVVCSVKRAARRPATAQPGVWGGWLDGVIGGDSTPGC
jgi:hypothetical protein